VALSRALPPHRIEYNAGDLPLSVDPKATPANGLTAEDTLRTIDRCGSWLVLKNVELDPEYKALLDACVDQVSDIVEQVHPGTRARAGFIFVSSPGSITPFHMDPEQNFLLQIRGRKTITVFDPADRSILPVTEFERFYDGGHRNLVFRDEFAARGTAFELKRGTGVHVPPTAPNWVRNGEEVSVYFSITFQTHTSARLAHVHRMNARLRRMGFAPRSPGESPAADAVKHLASRIASRVERTRARMAKPHTCLAPGRPRQAA